MTDIQVEFYLDNNRSAINPYLFSTHAEEWAKKICESGLKITRDRKTGKEKKTLEKNKISQIRKFYNEVLKYKNDITLGDDYKIILPYIRMLNAKAVYAEGRKLVTDEFKSFIKLSIEKLSEDNPRDFELLANFFEAFMGYYKYYESQYKDIKED